MPTDPWDDYEKIYPVGIHSSKVHKPNDTYPVYTKGEIEVPGREPIEVEENGGTEFPVGIEYPTYLNPYLVGVHGEQLYHEDAPHWQRNPALDNE